MTLFSSEKFFLERKNGSWVSAAPVAEGLAEPLLARLRGAKSCLRCTRPRAAAVELNPTESPGHTRGAGRMGLGRWPLSRGQTRSRGPALRPRRFRHGAASERRVDGRDLQSVLPGLNADSREGAGEPLRRKARGQGEGGPPAAAWTLRSPLLRQACKSCELPREPGCASSSLYVVPVTVVR